MIDLKAPFPWYGGKRRVAPEVWERFGNVPNYCEPFAGSLAVMLQRPHPAQQETVNDKDALLANFWRAVQADPEQVALWADQPINEADLHARHCWLIRETDTLGPRVEGDPDYYDAKIAGWWVWGLCSWIGSGWCSGKGPWWPDEEGCLRDARQLPHLGDTGQGVHRKLPHLGDTGRGVNRQLPHLGDTGRGVHRKGDTGALTHWFLQLQERLRFVRVACGDWARILGPSITTKHGLTGVFLDPPYALEGREEVYRAEDGNVAADVRAWCLQNGADPLLRIALCGYDAEHAQLEREGWAVHAWSAAGGYGSQGQGQGRENRHKERIWFSPACLGAIQQGVLFA